MPRNRRKRAASIEETRVGPAGTIEVLSLDVLAGKTIKKRAFEKIHFGVPSGLEDPLPFFYNDADHNADHNTSKKTATAASTKGPSRSVSVRASSCSVFTTSDHLPCRRKSKSCSLSAKSFWIESFV